MYDLTAPQTSQEWCENVYRQTDVAGFVSLNGRTLRDEGVPAATGFVNADGQAVTCSGESLYIMVADAFDEDAAKAKRDAFKQSALGQTVMPGEQPATLGGLDGTFTYLEGLGLNGGALFSAYDGARSIALMYLSFDAPQPADGAFRDLYGRMTQLMRTLPMPVNPAASACPVGVQGELVSGNVLRVLPFSESRLHAPELKPGLVCTWAQSVDGVETGRHTLITGWNDESIGGTLEEAGWRFCQADEKEYYLSDDNGRSLKFSVGNAEDSAGEPTVAATITVFDGSQC